MQLYELPAGLRARRAGALHRARRRRLRRRALAARGRAAASAARRIRDHAHHAMAPVWEANHVWLIFVLDRRLDRLPDRVRLDRLDARRSRSSSPAIGIVLRGAAYALRAGTSSRASSGALDTVVLDLVDPHAVRARAVVGAIASGRVPVGNAAGDLCTSWLNPTSIADRRARGRVQRVPRGGVPRGRRRPRGDDATSSGVPRAARSRRAPSPAPLAVAGLVVAPRRRRGSSTGSCSGPALPALIVSVAAGIATLALVSRRRYEPARYSRRRSRSPRSSPAGRSRRRRCSSRASRSSGPRPRGTPSWR